MSSAAGPSIAILATEYDSTNREVVMAFSSEFIVPDVLPYLLAVLALLMIWQYHQIQVMKGRILAIDVFDRTGIRFYIHLAANDPQTCECCRTSNGRAFLPSEVVKTHFTPLTRPCTGSPACTSVLVGLYGAWPEAREVLERLSVSRKNASVQLSDQELAALIGGPWERCISAATDRISVHMIEAFQHERTNPDTSLTNYRYIIDQAKEVRHLTYVLPSYLRLTELLSRQGNIEDAIQVIDQFEGYYKGKKSAPHHPSETHLGMMSIKKSRLKNSLRQVS
jgi:hypothetical protein